MSFQMNDTIRGVIGSFITILLTIVSFFLIQINTKFNEALDVIQDIRTDVKVMDVRTRTEFENLRGDVDSNTKAIKVLQDGQLDREKKIGDFWKENASKLKEK
jgi:hypothetical protein